MRSLQHWENKIKEKRKKTTWRSFIEEIPSWIPVIFYRNNGIISRFPNSPRIKITSVKKFEEYRDSLVNFGIDYDFSQHFFDNFSGLFLKIELPALIQYGINENCDFCDSPADVKNAYLSSVVVLGSENVCYSHIIRSSVVNCFSSVYVVESAENTYFSIGVIASFNTFYSCYIQNSSNIWFSSNLTGCSECIFCKYLDNASYYINNKKYEKNEYFKEKEKILTSKYEFLDWYKKIIATKGKNYGSTNTTGNFILDSENVEQSAFSFNTKNARNMLFAGAYVGNENIYDSCICGAGGGKDLYGVINSGKGPNNLYSTAHSMSSSNIYYSYFLESCSFCLGCIGLKNKSYCILNKQYSKEEWYELADKIFQQMEREGILGDFFPGELNPFYFNDTAAYLIDDSFTKEEVEHDGYMWRDSEIKVDIPEGAEIVKTSELNTFQRFDENGVWTLNPEILKKVIVDEKGNSYRIVKMEYDFLVKYGLPFPEIHWLERIKMGFRF